jgi:hypothetical protein
VASAPPATDLSQRREVTTVGYIGSLAQPPPSVDGTRLNAQGCSPELVRLLGRRFTVVLGKLVAALAQLSSGGGAVRQVLRDNFLDSSQEIRRRVQARVEEAITQAGRVLTGGIIIECSEAPGCCGGDRPACIMPERGLDRIIVCIPNLRLQQGSANRQEQILLHELFHRAGLRGPQMHALEFAGIDCVLRDAERSAVRQLAKQAVNPLEVVDLHVRAVWCLAALGGA